MVQASFSIDKGRVAIDLKRYLERHVAQAMKGIVPDIATYFASDKFVDLIEDTEVVEFLRSAEGRGFFGVREKRVEKAVRALKHKLRESNAIAATKVGLKIEIGDSDYLAENLFFIITRSNSDGKYEFIEDWYRMLVEGFRGPSQYKVLYGAGLGVSGEAMMLNRDSKTKFNKAQFSQARRNALNKKKNPIVEIWEKHGADIELAISLIVQKSISKQLSKVK